MTRYGYSIFCDDIRNEVGGKLSFIGCYNSVMFVPASGPCILPKFCVHSNIVSSADHPLPSVVLRCYCPGDLDPIFEEKIETPVIKEQKKLVSKLEREHSAPRLIVASASLLLSPFEINGPGLISMRAFIDDMTYELPLGSLRVVVSG
ncbi:hypothetical protein U8607_10630 [Methylobacterium durans]|uniref:hypothetical protein n=1 Tax=Methylobacterium durans TaxID=2202825 RepID=UPI002AFEB354|nr:hypothetical protein [Methylobacterium durans]MEA1832538.1 hypothetical protein [Methylobacterium durans]